MTSNKLKTIVAATLIALIATTAIAQQSIYRWKDPKGRTVYSDRLPPGSESDFVNFTNKPPSQSLPYATRKAAKDFPVTLYTATNCEQLCEDARAFLKTRKVPFSEYSIKTKADLEAFRERFGAQAEIPVLTVGTNALNGFEPTGWGQRIDQAGYPKN
ncbi:MAG: glutaredoxin family protein [Azoarcus sp.]|jgi:hypothetical protein|nr:glutaredoxin family protein [Azoarcus sp.]